MSHTTIDIIHGSSNLHPGNNISLIISTCSHGETVADGPYLFVEWLSYGRRARVWDGPGMIDISFVPGDRLADECFDDVVEVVLSDSYTAPEPLNCGCQ